jgi:hypothetical protein
VHGEEILTGSCGGMKNVSVQAPRGRYHTEQKTGFHDSTHARQYLSKNTKGGKHVADESRETSLFSSGIRNREIFVGMKNFDSTVTRIKRCCCYDHSG